MRHVRLQTGDDPQDGVITLRTRRDRHPGFGFAGKLESVRHHADYRASVSFDLDGLADDRRISAETPLPQAVTQNVRPNIGCAPSVANKFGVTSATRTRSGSAPPVRLLGPVPVYAATCAQERH